ncbi:hypothetical protein COHA_001213 [Chlorella ohadii]|uniref:Uncharacterized protein n=1 Tax=Chlorella ohadii TaxID=2649997 RepID=A0AAD5DYU6_9CHLO|nr:hypothetical protein COHA_001213 [Chlorella ohadii]
MFNLDVEAVYGERQSSAELGVQSVSSGKEEVTFKVHKTITLPNGKRKQWISAGMDSVEHAGALAYRGHEICVDNDWPSPWGLGYPEKCMEYSNNNFAGIHDFDRLYAASQMFTPIKGRLGVQGVRFVSLNTTKAKYRVQLNGKCTEFDRTDAGLEAAARHADQLMLARGDSIFWLNRPTPEQKAERKRLRAAWRGAAQ